MTDVHWMLEEIEIITEHACHVSTALLNLHFKVFFFMVFKLFQTNKGNFNLKKKLCK